jgi:transcriptional regulator with XRE-family HTH domain
MRNLATLQPMSPMLTIEQLESLVGESIKAARLDRNLSQEELASRSGISRRALINLESGNGSSLKTFIVVLKALGHEEWFNTIAPVGVNPFLMVENRPRLRASNRRRPND